MIPLLCVVTRHLDNPNHYGFNDDLRVTEDRVLSVMHQDRERDYKYNGVSIDTVVNIIVS